MFERIFIDTGFFFGILGTGDQFHERETASSPAAHQLAAQRAGALTIGRCALSFEGSWDGVRDR